MRYLQAKQAYLAGNVGWYLQILMVLASSKDIYAECQIACGGLHNDNMLAQWEVQVTKLLNQLCRALHAIC